MTALPIAAVEIDTGSFFAIVVVAALSAILVAMVPKRFAPPVVCWSWCWGSRSAPRC